ncbi:MAG: nodulation protein NfeD [Thermodesulfobacteriota bacterium]
MNRLALALLLTMAGVGWCMLRPALSTEEKPSFTVLSAPISGAISPAQAEILEDILRRADDTSADLVLLRLDTPGGLVTSMREMVQLILNSKKPVAVWVGPSGARAASAGVFLVAASAVAAMSPQSTIGAASPVDMGGKDVDSTMAAKVKNDIVSLVRGVAEARGRNVDWYVKSVEEADSITATEAAMLKVVDLLAKDPQDLMEQLAGKGVSWQGRVLRFSPRDVRFVEFEPGMRHKLLSWLLDPQVAYLLLLGGMAGIFFELTTPGAVFPGVFGGLCLLLGLYALSVLPTNVAGVLLILFGLVLFVLELKVVSYGMLTVAALVSLFVGSTILYRQESGMAGLPLSTIISGLAGFALLFGIVAYLVTRAQLRKSPVGSEAMVDLVAEVRVWDQDKGQVFVNGEMWKARTSAPHALSAGDRVRIASVRGLELLVEPLDPGAASPRE